MLGSISVVRRCARTTLAAPRRSYGMLGAEMIELAPALVPATLLGAGAWASTRYMVCNPHEMLVRTGLGIQDMDVTKKGMQWPFQDCTKIDMAPQTYEFELHNMSREKVCACAPPEA